MLTDLLERQIRLIPSATSQLASRSKTFQARIFIDFMVPDTLPIYDNHALLLASSAYHQKQYSKVILKCDRKNAGLGIHIFNDIEDVYNYSNSGLCPFPFVIQPYLRNSRDIRVVILGDFVEAYERINPHNFRNNLHCGGDAKPYTLSDQQLEFCRKVMHRGNFPYGHIDLMVTDDESYYLMEINLRGGLKGSRISGREYLEKIETIHEGLLEQNGII